MALVPLDYARQLSQPGLTGLNQDLMNLASIKQKSQARATSRREKTEAALAKELEKKAKEFKKKRKDIQTSFIREVDEDLELYAKNFSTKRAEQSARELGALKEGMSAFEKQAVVDYFKKQIAPREILEAYAGERGGEIKSKLDFYSKKYPDLFDKKRFDDPDLLPMLFTATPEQISDVVDVRSGGKSVQRTGQPQPQKKTYTTEEKKNALRKERDRLQSQGITGQELRMGLEKKLKELGG